MAMTSDPRLDEFIQAEEELANRRFESFIHRRNMQLLASYDEYMSNGGWSTDINLDDLSGEWVSDGLFERWTGNPDDLESNGGHIPEPGF